MIGVKSSLQSKLFAMQLIKYVFLKKNAYISTLWNAFVDESTL